MTYAGHNKNMTTTGGLPEEPTYVIEWRRSGRSRWYSAGATLDLGEARFLLWEFVSNQDLNVGVMVRIREEFPCTQTAHERG